VIFYLISKILGLRMASQINSKILEIIGPLFRSKNVIKQNLKRAFPNLDEISINEISKKMWGNYGRILTEYFFIKSFRTSNLKGNVKINGKEILEKIKKEQKPVIFVSGHFNNFELMAMFIEMSGIDLSAIYRPLNNQYINFFIEKIRKKYICKKQIKKGVSGTKELLSNFKDGSSIALMIDQRVSQGIKVQLFNEEAYTTTIPAQFVRKFNCKIVPVYIERFNKVNFNITIDEPIEYPRECTLEQITIDLNKKLEKMILRNPDQWIWTHNRWK
tara:strand:+ start:5431 stop:6252 length:822 start_codon:yes stop_codon:yes gene_type:complete